MNKFFKEDDKNKEYKYKVLVYPNITYSKDLRKDSYIIVLENVIKSLNKIRNDIHFTIINPEYLDVLDFPNTDQVIYKFPSYPNAMRTHFNYNEIMKIVDWQNNDFDVLYSHLPEHTGQLVNLFGNTTDISPYVVGYCHWYEINENTSYDKRMFLQNIAGTLEMNECGVNSIWLKEFIIDKAAKYFNQDVLNKLDKIIQPHYLGVDDIHEGKSDTIPRSILFNHRPNEYTGFKWFIQTLDELYDEGIEFKLYTTIADIDKPYAERVKISDRLEYLDFVRKMHIGVGTFTKYSAWSISTTDGLSQGVPYLLPNKLCYPEMLGIGKYDYPLLYDDKKDFKEKLKKILNVDADSGYLDAQMWISANIKEFLWELRVNRWFNNWKFLDNLPKVKRTESYEKIVNLIKKNGSMTKKEILKAMNWGVRISLTNYRNLLREEPNIKFTKNRYIYKK